VLVLESARVWQLGSIAHRSRVHARAPSGYVSCSVASWLARECLMPHRQCVCCIMSALFPFQQARCNGTHLDSEEHSWYTYCCGGLCTTEGHPLCR
jgi:hypothetical protein